ncbi:MAG: NFACT family protein [Ktedonobacterales bacterium]
MQVDALTLAALADEFRSTLIGARIEDIVQPTPHAVALQTYGNGRTRWLIVSAHPQFARLHYIERKPRKLVLDPPSFVMLLRKYLGGARITELRQPRWERLIEIGLIHPSLADQGTDRSQVWLIVEVMGRISNLILRDDSGIILGALRHVGSNENRFRTIAPHVPYRYPPPQTRLLGGELLRRLAPETVTAEELEAAGLQMLTQGPPQVRNKKQRTPSLLVANVLLANVAGFSRELAAESTARALADPNAPLTGELNWNRVAESVHTLAKLPTTNLWEPTLVYQGSAPELRPDAFAVYRPQQYGKEAILRGVESANAMLATYFEEVEWYNAIEGAKHNLRHLLQTQHDRTLRKQEALQTELAVLDEMPRLRQEADILLAFQSEIPEKVSRVSVENPFAPNDDQAEALTISLDPRLSAVENANKKYDRYHKLQRAGNHIPLQIQANELELARVEQLRTDLALAETPADIALVRAEVAEAGYLREKKEQHGRTPGQKPKARRTGKSGKPAAKRAPDVGAPIRRQSTDGLVVLVGKNSRQNEEITFHQASPADLWLHARGVPGSHVIVKSGGRPVPAATQREAAALAAYYSQSRSAGSVPVDITEQRFVRHVKGGGPGMVTYQHEHTVYAEPSDVGISIFK